MFTYKDCDPYVTDSSTHQGGRPMRPSRNYLTTAEIWSRFTEGPKAKTDDWLTDWQLQSNSAQLFVIGDVIYTRGIHWRCRQRVRSHIEYCNSGKEITVVKHIAWEWQSWKPGMLVTALLMTNWSLEGYVQSVTISWKLESLSDGVGT